uniref:outer dynein arm-docking complex subunit 3 n=1 Tax=Myxine glutinosa TaxID=7769 RepID=UPI00358DE244
MRPIADADFVESVMANGAGPGTRSTAVRGGDAICPTMQERFTKLNKTVHMLEEEQKTFHDYTQNVIKKNHEKICFLRKDNQRVRHTLTTTLQHEDENAFERIIQARPVEKATLKHKSKEEVLQIMDQKVCDRIKRLDILHYQRQQKQKKLQHLKNMYDSVLLEKRRNDTTEGEKCEEEKMLRILENRLDKSSIKKQQAEHMSKLYLKKRVHLQKQRPTFPVLLNSLEAHLLQQHAELVQLQEQTADAIEKRNLAEARLQHLQEIMGKRKQARLQVQLSFNGQLKKERMIFEHLDEELVHRNEMQSQRNLTILDDYQSSIFIVEQEKKKCILDETIGCITKATGVFNVQDILHRIRSQEETNLKLEKIKQKNDEELQCVIQQKEYLQKAFDQVKYSRESKPASQFRSGLSQARFPTFDPEADKPRITTQPSNHRRCLSDNENHADLKTQLKNIQKRLFWGNEAILKSRTLLDSIKTGIEHLQDKLNSISLGEGEELLENHDLASDESVMGLFSLIERKLRCLLEGLKEKDHEEILMLMEEEGFHSIIEGKQPLYITHFESASSTEQMDSSNENQEIASFTKSRAMLKKRSQKIIEECKRKRIRCRT